LQLARQSGADADAHHVGVGVRGGLKADWWEGNGSGARVVPDEDILVEEYALSSIFATSRR
jgi:hypothetical protein